MNNRQLGRLKELADWLHAHDRKFLFELLVPATDEQLSSEQWLREAAPVEGFIGFVIGRSIWWDALKGYLADELDRETAASQIAENYPHFIDVYQGQPVS